MAKNYTLVWSYHICVMDKSGFSANACNWQLGNGLDLRLEICADIAHFPAKML